MLKLIQKIESYFKLQKSDIELLSNTFYPVKLEAKATISKQGGIERNLYFMNQGIVRGYLLKDGKRIVEHLVDSGRFFGDLKSFMSEEPSEDIFESVTECDALKISRTDFELLKQSGKKWNDFIQGVINDSLSCKMERVRNFQTKTATERYIDFTEEHAEIAAHVSVEDIASFLGIEKQSLSRIRKNLISK